MARVIVFGTRDLAQLARFYLDCDSDHEVVAHCVHEAYLPDEPTLDGLPVVAFEEVQSRFPPERYAFFAPMSHRDMNKQRQQVYEQTRAKGYTLISYVSSRATVFPETPIGDNCFILEDNTLQPFTQIGSNVVLWSGNHIGHHSVIQDHAFLTSHVVVSGHCTIGSYAFVGVNASVRDGVTLSEGTFVAMAASITRDTDAWGVYKGNPAEKSKIPSNRLRF